MNNQNLKPVRKGQILNPKGRPKGSRNRSKIFKDWGKSLVSTNDFNDEKTEVSAIDAIVIRLFKEGIDGNVSAIKEILDSTFGKNKDEIEVLHDGEIEISNVIDMSKWK